MIDAGKITEAILATGCGPLALEAGSDLVEHWITTWESDAASEILGIECGWSVQLDDLTWAVGVVDCIMFDGSPFLNEWKSTKEPGRYWSEEKWLESIKSGPQIAVYALAAQRGTFYEGARSFVLGAKTPIRVRVRACVKTALPMFWPIDPIDGWQEFGEKELETVIRGFRNKAAQIRAMRKMGLVPWQLTGRQCMEWNRPCEYYDECRANTFPAVAIGFDSEDPAATHALPNLPEEARHPDAVILSASAYQDYTSCMEKGRRNALGGGKEENLALQTGTVMHAGCAEFYRQLREKQRGLVSA